MPTYRLEMVDYIERDAIFSLTPPRDPRVTCLDSDLEDIDPADVEALTDPCAQTRILLGARDADQIAAAVEENPQALPTLVDLIRRGCPAA